MPNKFEQAEQNDPNDKRDKRDQNYQDQEHAYTGKKQRHLAMAKEHAYTGIKQSRLAMAQEQTELINALLCGGAHPPGFNSESLQVAAAALVRKRIRCMQRANPMVEEICTRDNDEILMEFHRFIRENPSPHARGPYFDSLDFLAFLGPKAAATSKNKAVWKDWKGTLADKLRSLCQKS